MDNIYFQKLLSGWTLASTNYNSQFTTIKFEKLEPMGKNGPKTN